MDKIVIRKYEAGDRERVLELNKDLVHFLSPLDEEKLENLVGLAEMVDVAEVNGRVEAFLIAVREGTAYASVNYKWFLNHYDKFLYVDRVVVASEMHGRGIGKKMYEKVFSHARKTRVPQVTAEIDIQPPNPVSLDFHRTFGFEEVDTQSVYDGAKVVSLEAAPVK